MSSWRRVEQENRRLAILELLAQASGYRVNEQMLLAALDEYGMRPSRDALLGDLAWLAEQGLVADFALGDLVVVELRQRGRDVAEGRAVVPGVARPRPEV